MSPFGLTAPQWLRAALLGVLMAVVYLHESGKANDGRYRSSGFDTDIRGEKR